MPKPITVTFLVADDTDPNSFAISLKALANGTAEDEHVEEVLSSIESVDSVSWA